MARDFRNKIMAAKCVFSKVLGAMFGIVKKEFAIVFIYKLMFDL
jgi:hypothetical protein